MLAGMLAGLIVFSARPFGLDARASLTLAMAAMMVCWWVLEAMPLAVVAFLPIVLFPVSGVMSLKDVTRNYADPTIFLFMGGFYIALAIEKWHLHKRIALGIIRVTGTDGNRIILGFILATGFLSLWLSNTATTMMMFPIALSVIHVIRGQDESGVELRNFSLVLMLSIAYASNFALGTIIGTPPNVAYAAHVHERFGQTLGFTRWMLAFMPLTVLLLFMLYWVLTRWLYPNRIRNSEAARAHISEELRRLGPLTRPEKRVLSVFLLTVMLWVFKDPLNGIQDAVELDDTIIAMAGGALMFIMPSGNRATAPEERLLDWRDTQRMAWGILLMFGGGISLAKALEEARIMDLLGTHIAGLSGISLPLMILIVTTFSIFLSEVMSNVAQVIVLSPVISTVAVSLHMDPLALGIPMTLAASCSAMLPMGTPPNAIVFASGLIRMRDMIRTGFVLNILCIILITLFCWLVQPLLLSMP